jgi:hypothetical protein
VYADRDPVVVPNPGVSGVKLSTRGFYTNCFWKWVRHDSRQTVQTAITQGHSYYRGVANKTSRL